MDNDNNVKELLSDKYLLSVSEATRYFGINSAKLRNISKEYSGISLYNGKKLMIKRNKFEQLLDNLDNIW